MSPVSVFSYIEFTSAVAQDVWPKSRCLAVVFLGTIQEGLFDLLIDLMRPVMRKLPALPPVRALCNNSFTDWSKNVVSLKNREKRHSRPYEHYWSNKD